MRQLKITNQFTLRTDKSLDKYLSEISMIPMVTPDEEVLLAQKIHNKDQVALYRLVTANLRFVVSIAKQYQHQGLSLVDLINEGNIGLVRAAELFDETRGFKFISYGVWWVRQSILKALSDHSRIVRFPLNKFASIGKFQNVFSLLEQKFQRNPTPEEIASHLKIMDEEAIDMYKFYLSSSRHISFDAPSPFIDSESTNLYDIFRQEGEILPDAPLDQDSIKKNLMNLVQTLPEKYRNVIIYYYGLDGGEPRNLESISKKIGKTKERVRQMKEKALDLLRKSSKTKVFKKYLL